MSCAPRLISLSSSGKRNDSVSRESSVHSMISISWLLMKSISPMSCLRSPSVLYQSLFEDGLGHQRMDTLGSIDDLCHHQIHRRTRQQIGIVAVHLLHLDDPVEHLAGRNPCGLV